MTPKNLKIAIFPQEIVWGDKGANLDTLIRVMDSLHPETDVLLLPETFSTGFPAGEEKEKVRSQAERNTGKTMDTVKALAHRHSVAIAGSYVADSGGLLFNRAFFIEPNGEESFADKKHLFSMAGEQHVFSPGTERMHVRYRGWNISMIVCYDVRFPIWCRNRNNEYDLLLAVANWPKARAAAWQTLLQARAIENLAYVAGVNCKGVDTKGYEYGGESEILDFKGKPIGVKSGELIYAELSYDKLDNFRTKFPAWKDADF